MEGAEAKDLGGAHRAHGHELRVPLQGRARVLGLRLYREAGPEEDRCGRTRTISRGGAGYLTNDVLGCPNKGGLLSSQLSEIDNKNRISDRQYGLLRGEKGDDEVRGHGGSDEIYGVVCSDAIYGGPGADFVVGNQDDDVIYGGDGDDYVLSGGAGEDVIYGGDGNDSVGGGEGEDVLYGGDGNDFLDGRDQRVLDKQRDELYCGKGRDEYAAGNLDYVDSSCEDAAFVRLVDSGGPPLIPLSGAVLLVGSGLLVTSRYMIRRAS